MVTRHSVPRLSDSTNTLAFLSHIRSWFVGLWNLMLPNVQLLSTWQPMQMCCIFWHLARGFNTVKNCLKAFLPVGSCSVVSTSCLLLFAVQRTKDGLSFSIVWRSWCIALMGLSFVGAVGMGKHANCEIKILCN